MKLLIPTTLLLLLLPLLSSSPLGGCEFGAFQYEYQETFYYQCNECECRVGGAVVCTQTVSQEEKKKKIRGQLVLQFGKLVFPKIGFSSSSSKPSLFIRCARVSMKVRPTHTRTSSTRDASK